MTVPDQVLVLCRDVARVFRRRVQDECVPRIRACLDLLSEEQVWLRPNAHCNAIGNLLLHLEGNMRQWILAGLGGQSDMRSRASEFAATGARGTPDKIALFERLAATVRAAVEVIEACPPERLLATHPFQGGKFPDTGLAGVLHVLEHFSGHSYQIYDRTKQLTGRDLRFYAL